MAIKDRFSGNPEGLTRTNHKPEWATVLAPSQRRSLSKSLPKFLVGKGGRDGVWTGHRGVTMTSAASGFTKAQEGTTRLGLKEGVKPEVRLFLDTLLHSLFLLPWVLLIEYGDVCHPIDVTRTFVVAVVRKSFRSSVKIEESSSTRGEESGVRYFKRRAQGEDGVV
uniref:Uncharacterized protein n=1 Tax=Oryza brachyantha TaxID=4533 RepID=J3LC75_ORYBR